MNICSGNYFSYDSSLRPCSEFNDTVTDTGFCVYEVIRIVNGKCLFLEDHLRRLGQSVILSGHQYYLNPEIPASDIKELIVRNNRRNGNIKIILDFGLPGAIPSTAIFFIPHYYPSVDQYLKGVDITLAKFVRNDPNVKKIISYGPQVTETGYYETLLVNHQDMITEGSRSNVFFISGHDVLTAPDDMVLKGVTREKVLKVIKEMNINVLFKAVSINDLKKTDAVFLTGTSPKVLPVKRIDSFEFNVSNELLRNIMSNYNIMVNNYLCSFI